MNASLPRAARNVGATAVHATLHDARRRLGFYLRALWDDGRDLRGFPAKPRGARPFVSPQGLHLPDAIREADVETGDALYRAAVAHAAAHFAFPVPPQSRAGLSGVAIVLVGVLEDARVELLACRELPGLRRLWARFHTAGSSDPLTFESLAARLARGLLDPAHVDDDPWIASARRRFDEAADDLADAAFVRPLAVRLAAEVAQMRIPFAMRAYVVEPAYRDDNGALWIPESDEDEPQRVIDDDALVVQPEVVEVDGGEIIEDAGAPETEGVKPVGGGEPDRDDATAEAEAWLRLIKYPEWDHLIAALRPQWCTVQERRADLGDPTRIDDILHRHRDLLQRIDALIRGSELRKPVRMRRQMDGDHFDLDAVVNAMLDLRSGRTPDPRLHVRVDRRERDLSVLVLLDLSESTNDLVKACGQTVNALACEATVLLASAMERIGDRFAIDGFCSNGRGEVRYLRFKDFGEHFDEVAQARLAGMTGQLSTRMGAALRHATRRLRAEACDKRLILVITDGEPSDIDVHDPKYLHADTRKAVEEATRAGIATYCMSLDPKADAYVSRIFGARNWTVLDRIERLPEKLPGLYLRLTR